MFEVDATMVEEPPAIDGPFRAPSGPLPTGAIKPAAPRRSWKWVVGVALTVFALAAGAFAANIASSVRDARPSRAPIAIDD